MGNWSDLKQAVTQVIKQNGNQEITGQILQDVLNSIISNVGQYATFVDIATPSTNPGTPDGNVYYIASQAGTYANFGGISLDGQDICILLYNGTTWTVKSTGAATKADIEKLNANTGIDEYEEFSDQKEYKAGTTVKKDGLLYTFTTDHAAGAWNPDEVEDGSIKKEVEKKITQLNGEIYNLTQTLFGSNENLFTITIDNGYIDGNGDLVENSAYKSCQYAMTPGKYYYSIQLESTFIRIFVKENDNYTQVDSFNANDGYYIFYCPSDGKEYIFQKVVTSEKYGNIFQMSNTPKNLLMRLYELETTISEYAQRISGCENRIGSMEYDIRNDINPILSLFAKTKNLAVINVFGKYINEAGKNILSNDFNSSLINLEAGATYHVHQEQNFNIRVFSKIGDEYTQITSTATTEWEYQVPDEVDNYWLQTVQPITKPYYILWVSKDSPLTDYISPLTLKELENIKSLIETSGKSSFKLLAIGNSYSRDALSYVPKLIENIAPNIDLTIGILYYGGSSLQGHYEFIRTNANYEAFYLYDKTTGGKWLTTQSKNIDYALALTEWDVITLQQQSSNSRDYSTYQPYLNNIIDLLLQKISYPVKFGWLLTPSYPDGYSGLSSDTSDEMFEKICLSVQSVMDNTAVEFYIPCGTAIQNARTTSLKDLGDFGGLSYEGLHLQEGIPCLLEAYVATLYILDMVGCKHKGIYGNQVRPTQEKVVEWNVPQRNGSSVGVTDENCFLAQKCATMAIKNSLKITNINF
jgi:hypothetical protein